METNEIIGQIKEKYKGLGQDPNIYLTGLLHASPVNYWDYTEVDTLLTLQKPRTSFKDEEIFIMYHQVTELTLKMMIHEIKQLFYQAFDEEVWIDKIERLNRYTSMLISSFDIMRSGMNHSDYNEFRNTLTPASGFQSAQFRLIEIYCTRLENLVKPVKRASMGESPSAEECFENIYWRDAGIDPKTGEASLTLQQFEDRYLHRFIALAKKAKGKTLEDKVIQAGSISQTLIEKLKEFDELYNVTWPNVHLATAKHYIESKDQQAKGTGGSHWEKYLDPKQQQRKFFPELLEPVAS